MFGEYIALLGVGLASIEDIKTREVPDWLSFGMVFLGLGSALIYSIASSNSVPFTNSLAGFLACLVLAYLMFYTGQWGGGDSKLLMGIGALYGWNLASNEFPILVTFVFNLFLVGAFYGLTWSVYLAFKHRKDFKKTFEKKLYSPRVTLLRTYNLVLIFALFMLVLLGPAHLKVLFFSCMAFLYVSMYLWVFIKSIEDCCMIKKIDVSKLTEGDWIVEEIKVKGKPIYHPKELGVKKEQIAQLKKLKIKKVLVKEGVPFVPSFFIALIFTMGLGNWFVYFF